MNEETTATGIAPEMTIPDAVKLARKEAAANWNDKVRSALTMLADYAMPLIQHDEPQMARGGKPGASVIPHRKEMVDIYNIGGVDFVRQEGDGERITYTALPLPGHNVHPTQTVLVICRRTGGGWSANVYQERYDKSVMSLIVPLRVRKTAESAACRALSSLVSRGLHKARRNAMYKANRKARAAAAADNPAPLTPEEELADTIARQKEEA